MCQGKGMRVVGESVCVCRGKGMCVLGESVCGRGRVCVWWVRVCVSGKGYACGG